MIFILNVEEFIYHEAYIYKGIYHTKCKQDNLIFPEFGIFSFDDNYIYPTHLKLNISTICKKCLKLNEANIKFFLVKIKFGIK